MASITKRIRRTLERRARFERERVVRKGRRLALGGVVFDEVASFTPEMLAELVKQKEETTP